MLVRPFVSRVFLFFVVALLACNSIFCFRNVSDLRGLANCSAVLTGRVDWRWRAVIEPRSRRPERASGPCYGAHLCLVCPRMPLLRSRVKLLNSLAAVQLLAAGGGGDCPSASWSQSSSTIGHVPLQCRVPVWIGTWPLEILRKSVKSIGYQL
jgi:hypothetical protein